MSKFSVLSVDVIEMYGTRQRTRKERNMWDRIESARPDVGYHPTVDEILSYHLPLCQIAILMETYHPDVRLKA